MNQTSNCNKQWWKIASVAFATAALPVTAWAQDTDEDLEELEGFTVTGSRIERLDLETVAPVTVITSEAFESTGFSTVGDALRALPIVSGANLVSTDAGTSFTPGVSSVNLRGLGNNNTLALINGRRAAPFPTPGFNGFQNVVDFSSLPANAIESLEILRDGASALYGSDAVAGVINVQLVKEYDGLSTQVSYGNTIESDSSEYKAFIIGGASSGKTSIVFTANYSERNPIFSRDFPNIVGDANTSDRGGFNQRSSRAVSANVRGLDPTAYLIDPAGDPADPANQLFPNGQAVWRGSRDNLTPADLPSQPLSVGDFQAGNYFYNYQEVTGWFPKSRQSGFYTRMTYDFTEDLSAYVEASFQRNETEIAAAPTPLATASEQLGDGPNGGIILPAANPYNPFGVDLFDVRWRMLEVGNRLNVTTGDSPRIVAGLEGLIPDTDWSFDTAFLFNRATLTNTNPGTVFDSLVQDAFNGVVIEGETLYANPFGQNDPRVINYMSGNNPTNDAFELWSYDINASGPLFDPGTGMISLAVGAEYRFEELESIRTISNVTGNIVGGSQSSSVFGDRDIRALYLEANAPITEYAEAQVAVRYEDYSDFGDTTKPKFGLKIKPIPGVLVRGSFGQSFRAPDLPFLFSSGSVSFTSAAVPDPLRPDASPEQIRTLGGGNPNLDPEETDVIYAGIVIDMGQFVEALDGLSFELDYFKFEQTSVISRIGATTIVARAGDPFFDAFINRAAPDANDIALGQPGQILSVSTQWQNLDEQTYEGFDIAVQYDFTTENYGEFGMRFEGTYVDKFEQIDVFGNVQDFEGTYLQPQFNANATLRWLYGDWSASVFFDYTGQFDRLFIPSEDIADYVRVNPQVAYRGFEGYTITVGVRNVLDEKPPFDGSEPSGVNAGMHNPEPAFYYLRLRKDW